MNRARHYLIIMLIVCPVAILVIFRATSSGHFKFNTQKLAEASFNNTNIVSWEKLSSLPPDFMIIDMSEKGIVISQVKDTLHIPAGLLLERRSQKVICAHKGPILLYSDDPGNSAKAWMLLSEMGYRNIFILAHDTNNETMKYKFQPDSTQAGTAL